MSKPILYGTLLSGPVRAVVLTAKAIGLELEFKEIDLFKGEHLTEEYLKINPQHTVPTLVDDGKAIWDSNAIISYLVGKYASDDSLYPKDLYQRALVDQRLFFNCSVVFTASGNITKSVVFAGQTKVTDAQEEAVINCYTLLEAFLESGDYLVGNSLTLADLACMTNLSSMKEFVPIDSKKFTKLTAYVERIYQLPYFEESNKAGNDLYIGLIKKAMKDNIRKSFDSK